MEETVGLRAWPLDAASAAELFDGDDLPVDEAVLAQAPPPGVRFADLPAYLSDRDAMRSMEKAIKDRLPGELAGTVWTDPLTKATSLLGEDRPAFAARPGQGAGPPPVARLRDRPQQQKGAPEARPPHPGGGRTANWAGLGPAA